MIQVFRYIPELDAFLCTPEFVHIVGVLGLMEWTPYVWIGRLLCMDNDYGEHIGDNWDERDALRHKAKELGLDEEQFMIVLPARFQDGEDGPCHSDQARKMFWTDLLKSLKVSFETIVQVAREGNEAEKARYGEIPDYRSEYLTNFDARVKEAREYWDSWSSQ